MNSRLYPSRFSDRYYHLTQLRKQIESVANRYLLGAPDITVVDFGCGDMPYRPVFQTSSIRYVGVDLERNPKATIVGESESGTSLPDGYADVVLSTQVLEHVNNPLAYLEECRRILKRSGFLILSTHGYWMYHPDPTDLWRWTGAGLRKIIQESGYQIVECEGLMGLAASGMQLLQDGLMRKIPRRGRPIVALFGQPLIAMCDKLSSPKERRDDSCIFVVVARKDDYR